MDDDRFRLAPQKCPCRDCTDRHPGCHTRLCPNGWYEWDQYMIKRREEINKQKQEITNYRIYNREVMAKMKNRGRSHEYSKKQRGEW